MNHPQVLLTIRQWCQATQCCRAQYYAEVRHGRLRPVHVGNRAVRIPVEELQAWLQALRQTAPEGGG